MPLDRRKAAERWLEIKDQNEAKAIAAKESAREATEERRHQETVAVARTSNRIALAAMAIAVIALAIAIYEAISRSASAVQ